MPRAYRDHAEILRRNRPATHELVDPHGMAPTTYCHRGHSRWCCGGSPCRRIRHEGWERHPHRCWSA